MAGGEKGPRLEHQTCPKGAALDDTRNLGQGSAPETGDQTISTSGIIGVVGGGAWGTALAAAAAAGGNRVRLWAREQAVVDAINTVHVNSVFLPDCPLDPAIMAVSDYSDLVDCEALLMVVPTQFLRAVLTDMLAVTPTLPPLVICAKGIEIASGKLLSDVVAEIAPGHPTAILSGPTFAAEVARGLPCALTLAASDTELLTRLQDQLGTPGFRIYSSTDFIGAQVGGAVKNVLAVATGIVAGLALGENARAALITRGMEEIFRFGDVLGAERQTLAGLSGLGDVLLTCSSKQSRNFSLGFEIGEGRPMDDILKSRNTVAEGAHTAAILAPLAAKLTVDMPIMQAVYHILHEKGDVTATMNAMLNRPLKEEHSPL